MVSFMKVPPSLSPPQTHQGLRVLHTPHSIRSFSLSKMLSTTPYLITRRPSSTTVEYTVSNKPHPSLSHHLTSLLLFLLRATAIIAATGTFYAKWNQPPCSTGLFPRPPSFKAPEVATAGYAGEEDVVEVNIGEVLIPDSREVYQVFPSSGVVVRETESERDSTAMEKTSDHGEVNLPLCSTLPILANSPVTQNLLHSLPWGPRIYGVLSSVPLIFVLLETLIVVYVSLLRVHATESVLIIRGLGIQTSSFATGSLICAPASTRFIRTEKIRDVLVNEAFRGSEVRHYLLIVVEEEEDVVVLFPRLLPRKDIVTEVWRGVKGCLYEKPADGLKIREDVTTKRNCLF